MSEEYKKGKETQREIKREEERSGGGDGNSQRNSPSITANLPSLSNIRSSSVGSYSEAELRGGNTYCHRVAANKNTLLQAERGRWMGKNKHH